jgi:hypothetical protein
MGIKGIEMNDNKSETEVMREHIVWLGSELMKAQNQLRDRNEIMRQLLDPELHGWSVPQEIRAQIYNLFSHEHELEINLYNRK